MSRPKRLPDADIDAWLSAHPGWARVADGLERGWKVADFGAALAFAVRLGVVAEGKDHHPDLEIGWGRAKVRWTTHDAGGVTSLDLELAERTEAIAAEGGAR
ncbi:MAG: 4a-hydroxytetrahydrobiopterin dehydratase [Myxococcales bacterium]|nr:4a-hydroxytetrahydrobiopterin dehydratase [Myxococcales bacterium]